MPRIRRPNWAFDSRSGVGEWDLRDRVGSKVAESLVTRAMELSPANPSLLDERNAILMADTVVFGRKYENTIWKVFAHRGMGFYAGALSGDDASRGADFHLTHATSATGVITGKITDRATGKPLAGATVTLAFEGGRGIENPSAITGADGRCRIGPVPVGRYPKLAIAAPGYNARTRKTSRRIVRTERSPVAPSAT